jgi:sigma-E factor negative regulatory protein RseA
MKEQQRQAVSALLDGELAAPQSSQIIDALEQDPELRALWERYHMIGGAMRREGAALAWREIADQTRVRIAAEPTVLAPANLRRRHPSRVAPFAGVALAASAAFLAVFAVPVLFQSDVTSSAPRTAQALIPSMALPGPSASSTESAGEAQPGHTTVDRSSNSQVARDSLADRFAPSPAHRWHIDQPGVVSHLDRLLVSHQESAPDTGINRMLPYATLVSYGTGR